MKNAKFTSSKILYEKACEYFNSQEIPTLAGLALYLGIESKEAFLQLKNDEKLKFGVNLCLLHLEDMNSKALYDKNLSGGAKFVLENDFLEQADTKQGEIIVKLTD